MDIVICQYCNSEVSLAEIEKEGGTCPECGALVGGSLMFDASADDDFDEDMDDFGGDSGDDEDEVVGFDDDDDEGYDD